MIVPCSRLLAAALAAACALALSCGGDSPATSTSTPPATVAPTSSPGTGGGVGTSSCPIGMGSAAVDCSRGNARLLDRIEVAIDLTVRQKPQIFDLTSDAVPGSGQYKVLDPEAYLDGVVANLRAAGLCAQRDPDDGTYETIQVKDSNDYSEDFDVIVSSGFIRRGDGAYRRTCTPSSFPVERGADEPPIGSGCGKPFPPPITRFNCKLHLKGVDHYTLDSTPLVGPDCAYCASAGFTDGRCLCAVRDHGAPDRIACENWRVGTAKDTGRPGPTWTKEDGSYCTGPESGCVNSSDSQYQLWVYKGGRYKVEGENGASCTVVVER
jgi:hypothetical protein